MKKRKRQRMMTRPPKEKTAKRSGLMDRPRKRRSEIVSDTFLGLTLMVDAEKKKPKAEAAPREQDNSIIRNLGNWKAGEWKQTLDYSVPIAKQFPNGIYPEGEFMNHPGDFNLKRITDKEFRDKDRICESQVNDLRRAAECHRQVRKAA